MLNKGKPLEVAENVCGNSSQVSAAHIAPSYFLYLSLYPLWRARDDSANHMRAHSGVTVFEGSGDRLSSGRAVVGWGPLSAVEGRSLARFVIEPGWSVEALGKGWSLCGTSQEGRALARVYLCRLVPGMISNRQLCFYVNEAVDWVNLWRRNERL